ncbi:hypothetical protein KN1_17950 [Stygiolobus caldivivus]|uniref:ArsR family transcriptional regulator n=1 Tax=Stygiolobus caldivivus TaxID=2824673 RepID=A0A8D5ZFV8_9CREN|nr:hypothetical protein KN1_17950 [Stygiolobus caldivivus]
MKILFILFKEDEINITKLYKKTKIKYNKLEKDILLLRDKNLIEVIEGSKTKVIRLNYSNPKVIILKNLFEELDTV